MDGTPAFWILYTNTWRNRPLLQEFSISVISKKWGNGCISKHPGKMVLEPFSFSSCFIISNGLHCHPWCQWATALALLQHPAVPPSSFSTSNSSDSTPLFYIFDTPIQNWLLFYVSWLWSQQDIQDNLNILVLKILLSHKSAFNTRIL